MIQGRGTREFPDGKTFDGSFIGDVMNGNGTVVDSDGKQLFIGKFVNGAPAP